MRKQTPKLEWQIAESEIEWAEQQARYAPAAAPLTGWRLYRKQYGWSVVALLLLLVLAARWWRTPQAQKEQSATVAATVPPVLAAVGPNTAMAPDDITFSPRSRTAWQQLTQGLRRAQIDHTLATPYFIYHFREQDSATVRAVAPQLDALYTTLWRNFGLPILPTPEKLIINVRVTQPPGQTTTFDRANQVSVASPALYLAPVELTDAELLAQSLALPLLALVMAQAHSHHTIGQSWQPLLDGLYLWQVWDMHLPLAVWRENIVRWLYIDLPATPFGQPAVLPERYAKLCAVHKLWMSAPQQIYIPLVCTEQKSENANLLLWRSSNPQTHLAQLFVSMPTINRVHHPGETVALATLVEYTVATYGRERLPVLVAGLGQHTSWATLLPAVFGVSAAEFEAGWQAYLATHYGIKVVQSRLQR